MMKSTYDLSKIKYRIEEHRTWEPPDWTNYQVAGSYVQFPSYDFFYFTIEDKKIKKRIGFSVVNSSSITYTSSEGARGLKIAIELESILKENILDTKEGIYELFKDIFIAHNIPYSVEYPAPIEITSFNDSERRYVQQDMPSTLELMIEHFERTLGTDFDLQVKLEFDLPIKFEDIENAVNMEFRERALRKFGYEEYIKEGIIKDKIIYILYDYDFKYKNSSSVPYKTRNEMLRKFVWEQRNGLHSEKIIQMDNQITFLQVKDSSTNKIYFLKIPPQITDIQEAKAWTFGLEKDEYNPKVEA